jgi:hypothetical protein
VKFNTPVFAYLSPRVRLSFSHVKNTNFSPQQPPPVSNIFHSHNFLHIASFQLPHLCFLFIINIITFLNSLSLFSIFSLQGTYDISGPLQ